MRVAPLSWLVRLACGGALGLGVLLFLPERSPAQPGEPTSPIAPEQFPARLYADFPLVWIYARPERSVAPIGYLRAGQSVALRSEDGRPAHLPVKRGCGKGWYAVQPKGYMCWDQRVVSKPSRYFESMAALLPLGGAYPFEYALSMGSPAYRRFPTASEWSRKERRFGAAAVRSLPPHWRGHEQLVSDRPLPAAEVPGFLQAGGSVSRQHESRLVRRDVPFGSMLAVTGSYQSEGRTYLQSSDGTLVPADRFRIFERSDFSGIELSASADDLTRNRSSEPSFSLPVGWPRKPTKTYRLSQSGSCPAVALVPLNKKELGGKLSAHPASRKLDCLKPNGEWLKTREPVALSGRTLTIGGTQFAEKAEQSGGEGATWVPVSYLYVAERRSPPRALSLASRKAGGGDAAAAAQRWIHFRISQGTLVTYEGERALFATLASPGIGGVPAIGADPLSTRTTPVGTFRITFKHISDDMSPEEGEHRKFWIADVPYAMYFAQPFAIHVAYWHELFGEPMSGGCINVSPKDGKRLFEFTEPTVPRGWYGVGASRAFGRGTTVVIER